MQENQLFLCKMTLQIMLMELMACKTFICKKSKSISCNVKEKSLSLLYIYIHTYAETRDPHH